MKTRKNKITFAAAILAGFSFLSYGLGLLRDRLLASTFGAGRDLDVYQAAFLIPDVILHVFIAGALAAAIVPVLTDYYEKNKLKEANQTLSFLSNIISIIVFISAAVVFFLMPQLVKITAPGFIGEKREMLIFITRIMLFSPIIFGLSNLFGGALLSLKKFIAYSVSPVLYNAGIVIGILILAPQYGIEGVAIGTIIGALLHLSVRLISLTRSGFRYSFNFTKITPGSKKAFKLMLPRIFALLSWQGTLWAFVFVGSKLAEGSVSIFNIARNFQSLPVSLIGVSLATATFPFLAADFSKKKQKDFQKHFETSFSKIIFLIFPAAILMALLSYQIVFILLGTGKFDLEAVAITSGVLALFSLVIPFESINHLLTRTFYSRHNTIIPVLIYILSMSVNIAGCFILAQIFGIYGLPLAFLIGTFLQTVVLLIVLRWYGKIKLKSITISSLKVVLMTFLMGIVITTVLKFFPSNDTLSSQFIVLLIAVFSSLLVYIGFAFGFKIEEAREGLILLKKWVRKDGS